MYQRAGAAIEAELRAACGHLRKQFDASFKGVVAQMREDCNVMVERHSSQGTRVSTRRGTCLTKVRIQQALLPHFETLETAWGVEPEIRTEEVDESLDVDALDLPKEEEQDENEDFLNDYLES
jgi:hypothetical protein